MDKDSIFTQDGEGYTAIRTVVASEVLPAAEPDSVFCRDSNGNIAKRVVVSEGGGDQHNLGYYATPSALAEAHPSAEAGDFAVVGSTDTIWVWDSDTSGWTDTDKKGQVTSVNSQTGDVTITASDILPIQSGNSGKVLSTDGSSASWENITTVPATMPTLAVADWSSNTQTVSVTGVTATNVVFVSPAPASAADYAAAGIVCTAQGTDSLTFTCTTTPTNAITVNVIIM